MKKYIIVILAVLYSFLGANMLFAADTTPDPFTFTDRTNAALNTEYKSNAITVSGIDAAAAISVIGGTYSVNGGTYTSASSTVTLGNTVKVRKVSASTYSTTKSSTLTIGTVSDTFSVTTHSATQPDPFTFTDRTNAALSTEYKSNAITVSGLGIAAPISITSGTYAINGGAYTSAIGTVANSNTVKVRKMSAAAYATTKNSTLSIGGISDTFSVTTLVNQPMCVWNQAYQENYAADSVVDISANATGCYVLIDPFDSIEARGAIAGMKQKGNIVGCYISSGTCENWRDDFDAMKPYCVTKQWGEWPDEFFVNDPTQTDLINIMKARIDNMAAWGCNMVEFDNMDWAFDDAARAKYGFSATPEQAIAYNQTLCDYTHQKNMKCMAKNTRQGAESFDGGTFESYPDKKNWWVAAHLQGFLSDSKIGIIVHYNESSCDSVYTYYQGIYGDKLSYICEDNNTQKYKHYNQ